MARAQDLAALHHRAAAQGHPSLVPVPRRRTDACGGRDRPHDIPEALGDHDQIVARLANASPRSRTQCAKERMQTGRQVVGRRRVLRQSWRDCPTATRPARTASSRGGAKQVGAHRAPPAQPRVRDRAITPLGRVARRKARRVSAGHLLATPVRQRPDRAVRLAANTTGSELIVVGPDGLPDGDSHPRVRRRGVVGAAHRARDRRPDRSRRCRQCTSFRRVVRESPPVGACRNLRRKAPRGNQYRRARSRRPECIRKSSRDRPRQDQRVAS